MMLAASFDGLVAISLTASTLSPSLSSGARAAWESGLMLVTMFSLSSVMPSPRGVFVNVTSFVAIGVLGYVIAKTRVHSSSFYVHKSLYDCSCVGLFYQARATPGCNDELGHGTHVSA